ncbi:MAG: hypothetical protein ACUVQY_10565 [Thermoproteota archaeon]
MNVVRNERDFRTWYEDSKFNFDSHAKGIAGCEIGNAFLLKRYKDFFGIKGDLIIDKTGHNLDRDTVFDVFTRDGEKILWLSEWKSAWEYDDDISSLLSGAKSNLVIEDKGNLELGSRIKEAIKYDFKIPDYGYAFAIKITESHIEIIWEKVKIPKP